MENNLSEQDIESIQNMAEAIAQLAINGAYKEEPREYESFHMNDYPVMATALVDGLRYLLSLDNRILRACVVIESDSPNNVDSLGVALHNKDDILVSFVIQNENKDISFLSFGLTPDDDLASMQSYSESISMMEDRISQHLGLASVGDGSEITGGEDQ